MTSEMREKLIVLIGLILLSFFAGRDTCACGDLPEPESIEISVPTI